MTTRTVPVQEIVIAVDPARSGSAGRSDGLEIRDHLHGAFGPARRPFRRRPAHSVGGRRSPRFLRRSPRLFWVGTAAAATDKATSAPGATKNVKHTKSETPGKDQVAMDITPGLDPMAEIRFMEVMIGPQRQFVLFNGPGNSPVVAMQDDGSAKAGSGGRAGGSLTEESKQ